MGNASDQVVQLTNVFRSRMRAHLYARDGSRTLMTPKSHSIGFLRDVTGKHAQYDFILTEPAHCPNCQQLLTEKTLVVPK